MRCGGAHGAIPEIRARNLQRMISVNVADLEKFARRAVRHCLQIRQRPATNLTKLHQIFIYLVSDRRISSLHRQFLGQSGATDVLTFQHGEIFISVETARCHARRFGNSLAQELRLYVVHGLLHLHGLSDRGKREAQKMEVVQQRILQSAGRLN
jgi:probable rRNA maturation factor